MDKLITMDDTTHKNLIAERDAAQARVKELEEKLDEWKLGAHTFATRAERLEAEVAKLSSAGIKVEPARDYDAEIRAARIDALKTLGVNPYGPPVCILGAAKKRAKTLEHAQKFEDELAQIWELWGAGRPMTPGCVYEAAQATDRLIGTLNTKLGVIAELLDAAGLPRNYQPAQTGGRVSVVERVKLLIGQRDEATNTAHNAESAWTIINEDMGAAISELDGLGAPTFAGHVQLDISARIRALPGLLRQD